MHPSLGDGAEDSVRHDADNIVLSRRDPLSLIGCLLSVGAKEPEAILECRIVLRSGGHWGLAA